MPSAAPLTTPANSASPKLSAMVFCAVGQRLIVRAPRAQIPPRHVDRRSRRRPAKSVSANARAQTASSCHGKS
eukprot:8916894-Alexandrium_andersonii.AAC.1